MHFRIWRGCSGSEEGAPFTQFDAERTIQVVQGETAGFDTGKGEKLSKSQAQPTMQGCLAVA